MLNTLSVKFSPLEASAPEDEGRFTGYASVYGVLDSANDIIEPGAFTKTLAESGGRVPLLWQHEPATPVGVCYLQDSDRGLFVNGAIVLDTAKGREALSLMRAKALTGLSIGYETVKARRGDGGVRHLLEVRLWEVSLVTFPCNSQARITSAKALDLDRLREAIAGMTFDLRVRAIDERLARLSALTRN